MKTYTPLFEKTITGTQKEILSLYYDNKSKFKDLKGVVAFIKDKLGVPENYILLVLEQSIEDFR